LGIKATRQVPYVAKMVDVIRVSAPSVAQVKTSVIAPPDGKVREESRQGPGCCCQTHTANDTIRAKPDWSGCEIFHRLADQFQLLIGRPL
jgi:hypothetical protein